MIDFTIQREKLAQAVDILNEQSVDAWMTFVRETAHNADPALPLVFGLNVTWQAAFIISRTGKKIAIAGRYDCENMVRMGTWDEVIPYDQSIQPALLAALDKLNPKQIAVNYSESDSSADGLSHGMYMTLARYFEGKPYQMISSENILNSLRGRKSTAEIGRIRKAVRLTEEIISGVTAMLRPGLTEKEIYDWIQAEFKKHDVTPSWDGAYCPTVNCGSASPAGHNSASTQFVSKAGEIVHVDLGVVLDEYVSDIQRLWYLQGKNEKGIAEPVQRVFDTIVRAIDESVKVLKPGVQGWVVDAAARKVVTDAGYPEYKHALGHHIGRTVHDGSTLLGPKWERYGNTPERIVEAGNVYTLEPTIYVPGLGSFGIEEDVLVTNNGVEFISTFQRELMVVKER